MTKNIKKNKLKKKIKKSKKKKKKSCCYRDSNPGLEPGTHGFKIDAHIHYATETDAITDKNNQYMLKL